MGTRLALKFLHRDWRSGEIGILAAALIVAVASTTTIGLFADRLHRTMEQNAAEFLAADLAITSHSDMPDSWVRKAKNLGLKVAHTAEFASVVLNGEELLLAGIKACSSSYPLRGNLKTTTGELTDEKITSDIPASGETWVDTRVLERLSVSLGEYLEIGETRLKITRIITYEPDRRGNLLSMSPRILINYQDLTATNVIQPGSHVHYYNLFAGDEKTLKEFSRWVKPQLNPTERIMDVHQERPELGTALSRAERYLGLVSIVVVLMAGVAIAMATRRYSERHFDVTAMLRCLGLKQNDIIALYITQLVLIGVISSLVGYAIGWVCQEALIHYLKDLLPKNLASPSGYALLLGILTGLITLAGFALPPVLRLRQVSALKVFRRDLVPIPPSAVLVYGLAFSALVILMWRYTDNLKMTLLVVGVGIASMLGLCGLTLLLLRICRIIARKVGLGWRFGLQNLSRHPKSSISQIVAFCITLTSMAVIFLVRTDLIETWRKQLPDETPNHFAMNIFADSVESFKSYLQEENIQFSVIYPIVRGRLVQINGVNIDRLVEPGSYGERVTNRVLSLTLAEKLPDHNKIVEGAWRVLGDTAQVSVEQKLAESLAIKLGDRLTYSIGSQRIVAPVSSIRGVQWDAMKPTFYMMFSPGSLQDYPQTFLTSFFIPPENKLVLNRMIKRFPALTILEVEAILEQFRAIIAQVSVSVEFILVFALLAGFTVLFASIRTSIDSRLFEGALLRTLGANRQLLRTSRIVEFCGLGVLAGSLSALTTELIGWCLYRYVFDLEYHFNAAFWLITPIVGAVSIGLAGYLNTRVVSNKSPMNVMREL